MVKIEEKSLEERANERKHRDLLEITKRMMGAGAIDTETKSTFRLYGTGGIYVTSSINRVLVASSRYFDEALELAEAYEKATNEEFTLKKGY